MPTNTPSTYQRPTSSARRWLVYTGVVVAILSYLLLLRYIVGNTWGHPLPTALVGMRGDVSYAGVTATLIPHGGGELTPMMVATFAKENNYTLEMHVIAGDYLLTLTRGTTQVGRYQVSVEANNAWWWLPESEMPATEP